MSQPSTSPSASAAPVQRSTRSTAHASLAALGVYVRHLDLFGPVREHVHIAQKTVRYTPTDKLYDAFIALLAGAHGLVELNRCLRPDLALQAAFGRTGCAEQSVVQDTLDACTEATVSQVEAALDAIYRQHSHGYRHNYRKDWQILDVDMSGMPCGKKAALATPGYFAKQRNRRGRQLGRVLATRYHEIVVDRLFDGKTQLNVALPPLVVAAEQTLQLEEPHRQRTLIRIDADAGSVADINWLLFRGHHGLATDYSTTRATLLATLVTDWGTDPHDPERQVGLVPVPASEYHAGQHQRSVTRAPYAAGLPRGNGGRALSSARCPQPRRSVCVGTILPWSPTPMPARWPTSPSTTSAGAAWRPPSRKTSRGSGSPSAAKSASLRNRSWSRSAPLPTTCWSGPSAGCSRSCPASPASASSGWFAMCLASAAASTSLPTGTSPASSSTRPTAPPAGC
jgi:hypothetical protein